MPMIAEEHHRIITLAAPNAPIVKPRLASRKPGLQSAITNPSHQRSVFRSCRSSTTAVAISTLSLADVSGAAVDEVPYTSLYKYGQPYNRAHERAAACA